MVRTQVYLTPAQHRALRKEAQRLGVSMTEVIRRAVSAQVEGRAGVAAFPKEAILSFVALGKSGRTDTSERHDDALDEAFRDDALR